MRYILGVPVYDSDMKVWRSLSPLSRRVLLLFFYGTGVALLTCVAI